MESLFPVSVSVFLESVSLESVKSIVYIISVRFTSI